MKILFDQNLSPKLAVALADLFPGSTHVIGLQLDDAEDWAIWNHAAIHGFVVATKDADFKPRSLAQGHPPKIIMVQTGNCLTARVQALFRSNQQELADFELDPVRSLIELS